MLCVFLAPYTYLECTLLLLALTLADFCLQCLFRPSIYSLLFDPKYLSVAAIYPYLRVVRRRFLAVCVLVLALNPKPQDPKP